MFLMNADGTQFICIFEKFFGFCLFVLQEELFLNSFFIFCLQMTVFLSITKQPQGLSANVLLLTEQMCN